MMKFFIALVLTYGVTIDTSYGATQSMLAAKGSVFRLEVQQKTGRIPIVGAVFAELGSSSVGYGSPHESTGTATLIDRVLYTNFHVVDNAEEITLIVSSGESYRARVVVGYPDRDVAVLELLDDIDLGKGLRLSSREVTIGEPVVALGFGAGLVLATTEGIVTAHYGATPQLGVVLDRIWTDALITEGFSGGPLVNAKGECVGLLHAYGNSGAGLRDMGFVVPASLLSRPGAELDGWDSIGLMVRGTAEREGVVVEYVRDASAAARVGMLRDDTVRKVNGETVRTVRTLREVVVDNQGLVIHLEGTRNGEDIEWRLERSTDERNVGEEFIVWRGLTMERSDPGLYVVHVEPNSLAGRAGFSVDDRIIGLNGGEISDSDQLWSSIQEESSRIQMLWVLRGDQWLSLPTGPE
jgi:S1-C subfamily serine protease